MSLAGFVMVAALYLLNAALISGKGALAMAISQTQSFFWLLFEIVISLRIPYAYEAIAMCFGICGAIVITVARK